jgi:hypothetical protein
VSAERVTAREPNSGASRVTVKKGRHIEARHICRIDGSDKVPASCCAAFGPDQS